MSRFPPAKIVFLAVLLLLVVMGLARISPGYTYVRVSDGEKSVEVENFGFGRQKSSVQTPGVKAESSSW